MTTDIAITAPATVTRDDAEKHFAAHRAIGSIGGMVVPDPRVFFTLKIIELRKRAKKERAMDTSSEAFINGVMGESFKGQTPEDYFRWFDKMFAFQLAYLFAIEHDVTV